MEKAGCEAFVVTLCDAFQAIPAIADLDDAGFAGERRSVSGGSTTPEQCCDIEHFRFRRIHRLYCCFDERLPLAGGCPARQRRRAIGS